MYVDRYEKVRFRRHLLQSNERRLSEHDDPGWRGLSSRRSLLHVRARRRQQVRRSPRATSNDSSLVIRHGANYRSHLNEFSCVIQNFRDVKLLHDVRVQRFVRRNKS